MDGRATTSETSAVAEGFSNARAAGNRAPAGVYFADLRAGADRLVRRFVLVR